MSWREQAACADVDPELFFPLTSSGPSRFQTAQAIAVCARCPVRAECLDWSLRHEVHHGVWGGCSEDDRNALLRRRTRSVAASG